MVKKIIFSNCRCGPVCLSWTSSSRLRRGSTSSRTTWRQGFQKHFYSAKYFDIISHTKRGCSVYAVQSNMYPLGRKKMIASTSEEFVFFTVFFSWNLLFSFLIYLNLLGFLYSIMWLVTGIAFIFGVPLPASPKFSEESPQGAWPRFKTGDPFGIDPDPQIYASDWWIRIKIKILRFSSLTFKTPTKN